MADPSTLYPEQQDILIALKQLFTAVECEVNKATITPQIFHDILIHLEQTHEQFHRFEFVKILQKKIDDSLSVIIENELTKRPNSDPLDVIPEVTDVVFSSPEFVALQESFCLSMQEVIDVMVEIYHDPIRWEIGTPYLKDKNYVSNDDLSSSSNQTGCMFFTSDQYFQIAQNLDPGMPKHVRQNALNCLFKTAPGECEHWPVIRQGIMDGLADEDYNFAEESLSLHAKLFNSGTSHSTAELYTSLSGHLVQHFQSSVTYHVQMRSGLDTAHKNTRCLLRRFMLLSIFQHDITSFWIRCPERYMIQPITQTIELLSLSGPEEGCMQPVHFLSLFDHKALWFRKWLHGCFSRNLVINAMKKFDQFLKCAIECVSSVVIPDIAPEDIYSAFTYSWRQLKYLQFVHSANVIANVVQYKAGRDLIRSATNGNGVVEIMKKLILTMSLDNCVFNLLDSSLHPQTIISELLREIIVSGEECRKLLSNEQVLETLLQPLLDLPKWSTKCIQAVCDILSLLTSYSVGSVQLINTTISFKETTMSMASVIGEQCKDLMGGRVKDLTPRDKDVLSALLFLARQIYTTHEGLAVMSRVNIVSLANELLSVSGDLTPQPPVLPPEAENKEPENCFEEILVDNMLGFASTPKGLLFLYKGGMLDQCIEYLYQRKCKKLQVSKTQKFGYGYMVSQIVGIPAGLQALERCGFIRQLSQNLWWLLENGGPPAPVEVPLTQPPDPYFEGVVLKAMTSLIQVLISYDSLHSILTVPHSLVSLDPELFRQPEPLTIHDILQRIIFIDSPSKSKSLMNYDIMQIFGLRILSVLLSCLDTLLYFVDTHDIIRYLLKCQEDSQVEGKIVIDDASIERNRILVRSTVLGGYTEKVIPPRLTKETMSDEYPFTLFHEMKLPECYITSPPSSSEAKDDVKLSAMLHTDTSSDSWLDKTRSFVLAACRKPSFTGHVGLMEVVLKYQLQDSSAPFTAIRLDEGPENITDDQIKISGLEYGCQMIVKYGVRLKLLSPTTEPQSVEELCKCTARALLAQQHNAPKSLKFDWFVCVVYLLFGGQIPRIRSFLSSFSTTLTSSYLWSLRLLNSVQVKQDIASSGLTVTHYNACHSMERVLQKALPKVACAFRISGMSPSHVVKRWINSCFLNILPWNEICNYVLIVVSEGPVYLVLYCMALLKHLETRLLHHSTQHTLLYDVLEEPVQGFVLANYLDYITGLNKKFGAMLRRDLADFNLNCDEGQ